MVWAAAGWTAGPLPRLLCDGAEPGWSVLSNAALLHRAAAAAAGH